MRTPFFNRIKHLRCSEVMACIKVEFKVMSCWCFAEKFEERRAGVRMEAALAESGPCERCGSVLHPPESAELDTVSPSGV